MSWDDPDLPLWRELQEGKDTALDTLMKRHGEALFRFVIRYVLSEEDAREIVQETFIRAYFKRHQFQPRARVSTWLYQIALNLCRDHARSRAGRQSHQTESITANLPNGGADRDFASSAVDPSKEAALREDLGLLHAAIQELPHELKSAFILAVLEDYPQKDCAVRLGITPKAVETRVYRARKILEAKLGSTRAS